MSEPKRRTAVKIFKKPKGRRAAPVKSSIAWQNKDVTSKYFGENLKGKSFAVYGLELPEIKEVQPTNLPAIEANELRLDNLFLLKDDSLALVDYESNYADSNKIKYLNYIVRTLKRNMEQSNFPCKIRMIVLYTADIQRFLLSGMLVFADKVITKEDSKQIKEWIMMTKVGQLFLEEKIQYGQEIEKQVTKDVTKRVTKKVTKDVTENVTKNVTKRNELKFTKILLHAGLSIEEISSAMTVLTADDVQKIAERMSRKSNNRNAASK